MDNELLHILQHSLGLDQYGQGNQYRNHFCAGGKDVERCRELVAMGYMREFSPSFLTGDAPGFIVTPSGIDAVALHSPKPPKLSRGKRRYRAYLHSECGESFGEWLKNSYWDDYRRECNC
jgi:hypothetical protein